MGMGGLRKGRGWVPSLLGLLLGASMLAAGSGMAVPAAAATLSGAVFNDINNNGVLDNGDAPLAGIIVQIRSGATRGVTLAQVTTGPTGGYFFTNVPPGTYRLVQLIPLGGRSLAAYPGPGAVAVDSTTIRVTVLGSETIPNNNFLDQVTISPSPTGVISGAVLQDTNGTGVPDAGDRPVSGVPVVLRNSQGGFLAQTTTDVNGAYAFSGLSAGTYLVTESVPANFAAIGAFPGPGGFFLNATTLQVTLAGGSSGNNLFLLRSTVVSPTVGIISGSVFRDVNGNRLVEPGIDQLLPGVTIQLFTGLGVFVTQTTTDINGAWAFGNLPPGSYLVQILVPSGFTSVGPTVVALSAFAGINNGNNNFLLQGQSTVTGTISGSVFQDLNGNGRVDFGTDGLLPGVQVILQNSLGGFLRSFITDVNGAYAFSGLAPGTYRVMVTVPANFTAVGAFPGPGGGVALNVITLQIPLSGGTLGNNNFLLRSTVVSPTVGILSGSVFRDANGNGFVDFGIDPPLAGITIRLFTSLGAFVTQTTTDVNGAWAFSNLPPGSYIVQQLVPSGYTSVGPATVTLVVTAGVNNGNNNFLDQVIGTPGGANTISGFAIEDRNLNGVADNEPGLAGMRIVLSNQFGTPIAAVTTNATGVFSFTGVPAGTYTVTATPPPGLTSTNAIPGVGGVRLNAASVRVSTMPGVTDYASQLFLAGP